MNKQQRKKRVRIARLDAARMSFTELARQYLDHVKATALFPWQQRVLDMASQPGIKLTFTHPVRPGRGRPKVSSMRMLRVMSGVRTRAVYMTDCRIIPATARNAGGLNHFLRRCPRE